MAATALTTDNRPLIAKDESGAAYVVTQMEVEEKISEPFKAEVTLISNQFDQDNALGRKLTVTYQPGIGQNRKTAFVINGIMTRITAVSPASASANCAWQITLKPWISMLELRKQCRIFQTMDIKKIIDTLCSDYSLDTLIKFDTRDSFETREFCVQYNESDLDFLSRLLAEEGLHYHFQHSDKSHTLTLGSDNQAFTTCTDGNIEYSATASNRTTSLLQWRPLREIHPQDAVTIGYSREQAVPVNSRCAQSASATGQSTASTNTQWLSRLIAQEAADQAALSAIHQGDCQSQRVAVQSSFPGLHSGVRFKLDSHPDSKQQGEYIVVQAIHHFHAGEKSRQKEYSNDLVCLKSDFPYAPPSRPGPRISGVQTATVSGPDDQELYTDGSGSIKVRFHWDTSDSQGDSCSAWIPVVQPLAGQGFGASLLPRVGQEVVVSFVDGDPDQPLITGCLYNGKHTTPYDDGNIMGLKTLSMTSGNGGHEVRLNDKKDSEEFYIRSQKDLQLEVMNDMSTAITGNLKEEVDKDHNVAIKQSSVLKADQNVALESGQNFSLKSGLDLKVRANASATYKSTSDTKISGTQVAIEAQAGISLKCGSSELKMDPGSITIKAPMVTLEAQAMLSLKGLCAELKGTTQTAISGLIIDVNANTCLCLKGSAMVIVQGGLTKIN
ncbi:MAG: type VI secretion system Vgr family protein [Endozoicomonas sp.]